MRTFLAFEIGRLRARLDNTLDGRGRRERLEALRLGLAVALPLSLLGAWLYLHVSARPTAAAASVRPQLLAQSAALTALLLVDAYRRARQKDAFTARYQSWLLGQGVAPTLVGGRALAAAVWHAAPYLWVPLVALLPLRETSPLGLELLAIPAAAVIVGSALGSLDAASSRARWLRLLPAVLWAAPAAAAVLPDHSELQAAAPLLGLWALALGPHGGLVCFATILVAAGGGLVACAHALAASGCQDTGADAVPTASSVLAGDHPQWHRAGRHWAARPNAILLGRDVRRLQSWATAEPLAPLVLILLTALPYVSRLPTTSDGASWALLWSVSVAAVALVEILFAHETAGWWSLLRVTSHLRRAAFLRAGLIAAVALAGPSLWLGFVAPVARGPWLALLLALVTAATALGTAGAALASYADLGPVLSRLLRTALTAAGLLLTYTLALRQTPVLALVAALVASALLLWLAPRGFAWSEAHSSTR